MVVTLVLGVILSLSVIFPFLCKSDHSKKEQRNAVNKLHLPFSLRLFYLGLHDLFQNVNQASNGYNKVEVSLHDKGTNYWNIIKDKVILFFKPPLVYDVTSYVEEHPGGDAILAHTGDDSTEGFYGPQHATRVFDMIDDFYIGDLGK